MNRPMREALREAREVLSGWWSGGFVAACALLAAFLGTVVSPIAAAITIVVMFFIVAAGFTYALRIRALFDGPYVLLDNEVSWELDGTNGEKACVRNHRHVRFNYRCAVILERISGMPDGTILSFQPEYGTTVKAGKRPDEEYAIVELLADKHRNDVGHLTSRLTLNKAFDSQTDCWIEHEVTKQTKKAKLDVAFPVDLKPADVRLWRESSDKTEPVPETEGWEDGNGVALWTEAGRLHFRLRERPKRVELYRLEWRW
jgi:hypothetical protein